MEMMIEHMGKIAKHGNSATLRLTTEILKMAALHVGSAVQIIASREGVMIKPVNEKMLSLTDMLAACDPAANMPEDLKGWERISPVGAELI